jgi:hypothetical protein
MYIPKDTIMVIGLIAVAILGIWLEREDGREAREAHKAQKEWEEYERQKLERKNVSKNAKTRQRKS